MLVWILAIVLLLLFGVIGFFAGTIRTVVSIIGFFVSLALAMPIGNLLRPYAGTAGVTNPIWVYVLPPLVAFLLVSLVVFALSFLVHRLIDTQIKQKATDYHYALWDRFSRRLGICIGLCNGLLHFVLVGWVIYVGGYVSHQLSGGEGSGGADTLNSARMSLRETGLDKLIARYDKTPESFYQVVDVLGLAYHNPLVHGRLANYPPYLFLSERPEFVDIATDTDLRQQLQTKASLGTLLENPKIQTVVTNTELIGEVLNVDLKDLRAYLETGKAPKFADERILGRWSMDPYSTLLMARKFKPNMTAKEMNLLRRVLTAISPYYTVIADNNNKAVLSFKGADEALKNLAQQLAPPPPPRPADGEAGQAPTIDPVMAQRYNLRRPPGGVPPPQAAPAEGGDPAAAAANQPSPVTTVASRLAFSAQGTWEKQGIKYQLKLQDDKGRPVAFDGQATDEELVLTGPDNLRLVFLRVD